MGKKVIQCYSPTEMQAILRSDNMAIAHIEKHHMREVRNSTLYIANEEVNMLWAYDKVEFFDEKWTDGQSLLFIANALKRPMADTALLLFDRAEKGKVKPRRSGIWGL